MCTIPTIPHTDRDSREVIYILLQILCSDDDVIPAKLLIDLLNISRAILYLDDVNDTDGQLQDKNWSLMFEDKPSIKTEPHSEMLVWSQDKMIALGAINSVLKLASHKNPGVHRAAFRLGIALLREGNKFGQTWLLGELRKDEGKFLRSMAILIRSTREIVVSHAYWVLLHPHSR